MTNNCQSSITSVEEPLGYWKSLDNWARIEERIKYYYFA